MLIAILVSSFAMAQAAEKPAIQTLNPSIHLGESGSDGSVPTLSMQFFGSRHEVLLQHPNHCSVIIQKEQNLAPDLKQFLASALAAKASDDGESIVALGQDKRLRVMSLRDKKIQFETERADAIPINFVLSPNGSALAIVDAGNTLTISSLREQKLTAKYNLGSIDAKEMSFSPDSHRLVVLSPQRGATVFVCRDVQPAIDLELRVSPREEKFRRWGTIASFTADSKSLIAIHQPSGIYRWDIGDNFRKSEVCSATYKGIMACGNRLFLVNDKLELVTATLGDGKLAVTRILKLPELQGPIALSSDGKWLAHKIKRGPVTLLELDTNKVTFLGDKYFDEICSLGVVSPDVLVSLDRRGCLGLWSLATKSVCAFGSDLDRMVVDAKISPGGDYAAIVFADHSVTLINCKDQKRTAFEYGDASAVELGAGKAPLLVGNSLGQIRQVSPTKIDWLAVSTAAQGVSRIALSQKGSKVAVALVDGAIHVRHADKALTEVISTKLPRRGAFSGLIRALAISDQHVFAAWSRDSRVSVLSATTGEISASLDTSIRGISSLAVSASGKFLIVGGIGSEVELWDIERSCLVKRLSGPMTTVGAVAFSIDEKMIFAGSGGGTVLAWQVK